MYKRQEPDDLAAQLHAAAPMHFPDDWMPSVSRVAYDTRDRISKVNGKLERLDKRIERLENVPKPSGALGRAMRWQRAIMRLEAAGWTVEDTGDKYVLRCGDSKSTVDKEGDPEPTVGKLLGSRQV